MLHGGPVAALLARELELGTPGVGGRIGRLTVEILGPVQMERPLTLSVAPVRPGRRIALSQATAFQPDDSGVLREVARAQAWWIRTTDTAAAVHRAGSRLEVPGPQTPSLFESAVPDSWRDGFIGAMNWRVQTPIGLGGGAAIAWTHVHISLVDDEPVTDFQRAVAAADTANGIGAQLDPRDWTFINTELTVHLFDLPHGDWIGIEAESSIGPDGIGMGSAVLHSANGQFGRVAQCLIVERTP